MGKKYAALRGGLVGLAACVLGLAISPVSAADDPTDWPAVREAAKGQTVYFNAWGGDPRINDYIAWVGDRVSNHYGVALKHVKLSDTANAVNRVLTEKSAGRDEGGSIDLIWINGENFAAMKRQGLLYGPWSTALPNYDLVDVEGKPTVEVDFTVPVDGLEAPWGMARFVFMYDTAHLPEPPRTAEALLAWAASDPGRFTYPRPPDYIGSTFLKQMLATLASDPAVLSSPPLDQAAFDTVAAPLWAFLDRLHPTLWRSGKAFPGSSPEMHRLLGDGELSMALSFDPEEASSLIEAGRLPESVRTFVPTAGSIGNTHFVAIPYNANAKAGAMVVADFLMSPEAQARKEDPRYWGNGTVLAMDKLSDEDRALFEALPLGIATLPPAELGQTLPEPHPAWMEQLEAAWQARYGDG